MYAITTFNVEKKPSIAIFFKRNYSKMPSLPKVFTVGSQFPSEYICCPFLYTFFLYLFVYIWFNICYCIFLIRKSIKDLLLTLFVESNPTLDIFKGVNEIYFTDQYILILKFLFFNSKFEKLFWYFRYYELWN